MCNPTILPLWDADFFLFSSAKSALICVLGTRFEKVLQIRPLHVFFCDNGVLLFSTALPRRFSMYNQVMAQIEIKKLKDFPESKFEVTVRSNTVTKHEVTLTQAY